MTVIQCVEHGSGRIQVMEDSDHIPNSLALVKDYMLDLCQPCGETEEALAGAAKEAYWVDERLTPQRAAHKVLKSVGCTAVHLGEEQVPLPKRTERPNRFVGMRADDPLIDRAVQQVTLRCMSGVCLPKQETLLKRNLGSAKNGTVDPSVCATVVLEAMACPKLANRQAYGPCK